MLSPASGDDVGSEAQAVIARKQYATWLRPAYQERQSLMAYLAITQCCLRRSSWALRERSALSNRNPWTATAVHFGSRCRYSTTAGR